MSLEWWILLYKLFLLDENVCLTEFCFSFPASWPYDTMKETLAKMAELKFEAPLAQFEETEEWQSADFRLKNLSLNENHVHENKSTTTTSSIATTTPAHAAIIASDDCPFEDNDYAAAFEDSVVSSKKLAQVSSSDPPNHNALGDNFDETVSGSLEDLVNTFDDKITRCFYNYQESVEKLAPVQVRSQEEIMNECQ